MLMRIIILSTAAAYFTLIHFFPTKSMYDEDRIFVCMRFSLSYLSSVKKNSLVVCCQNGKSCRQSELNSMPVVLKYYDMITLLPSYFFLLPLLLSCRGWTYLKKTVCVCGKVVTMKIIMMGLRCCGLWIMTNMLRWWSWYSAARGCPEIFLGLFFHCNTTSVMEFIMMRRDMLISFKTTLILFSSLIF